MKTHSELLSKINTYLSYYNNYMATTQVFEEGAAYDKLVALNNDLTIHWIRKDKNVILVHCSNPRLMNGGYNSIQYVINVYDSTTLKLIASVCFIHAVLLRRVVEVIVDEPTDGSPYVINALIHDKGINIDETYTKDRTIYQYKYDHDGKLISESSTTQYK